MIASDLLMKKALKNRSLNASPTVQLGESTATIPETFGRRYRLDLVEIKNILPTNFDPN
jgi:hypothetical protein